MPSQSPAAVLMRASPAELGFDAGRLGRIRTALERDIAAGLIPGAVVGVARRGRLALLEGYGYRDKAAGAPMWADAIFSIASMTKPMTSVAVMMLAEEGRLLLGDPVSKHLPGLTGLRVAIDPDAATLETRPATREMTIQDLLRHTSGLSYDSRGTGAAYKAIPGSSIVSAIRYEKDELIALIAKAPLIFEPGTTWEYGFSTDVLGFVVEAVSGMRLADFLAERIWRPLGMADTAFDLPDAARERYARALPVDPITGEATRIHHASAARTKWDSGGGGCVSTAADYLRFAQMLLNGGAVGGVRLLGPKTVALMTADHLGDRIRNRLNTMDPAFEGYGFGLGFGVRKGAGIAAAHGTAGDYYWSGVYGTYFWNDPAENLSVVFMAAAPGQMRLRYRQLIRATVLQALVDR